VRWLDLLVCRRVGDYFQALSNYSVYSSKDDFKNQETLPHMYGKTSGVVSGS
jgi:hypothetical protein